MRAKTINEVNKFERGQEPKRAMKIGMSEKIDMMTGMNSFAHWLYNVDSNFIEKIWGKTIIADHFTSKLKGILSKSKDSYMDPTSLMKFFRELDDENRRKLFEYIIKEHKRTV